VGKVHVVVAAQAAKVGHDALTGLEAVVMERPALPLGEREGNFQLDVLEVPGSEGGGPFDAVLGDRRGWVERIREFG
jgi:hypothetical protein